MGAVEADGTQGQKLSDFLALAHKTLGEMCSNRPAEFPVVATDAESDTTIEVYMDSQNTPTTALRKDNPRLAVVTEWFEPVDGGGTTAPTPAPTSTPTRP